MNNLRRLLYHCYPNPKCEGPVQDHQEYSLVGENGSQHSYSIYIAYMIVR